SAGAATARWQGWTGLGGSSTRAGSPSERRSESMSENLFRNREVLVEGESSNPSSEGGSGTSTEGATESVEILDPEVQQVWQDVAESGAGALASSYVLCTAIVGLNHSGVASRLSREWTPLSALTPDGASAERIAQVLRFLE